MSSRKTLSNRILACGLILIQLLVAIPADAMAASQSPSKTPEKVVVNRKVPSVTTALAYPHFSAAATDQELFVARVFEEPLVPMSGTPSAEENQALAAAASA